MNKINELEEKERKLIKTNIKALKGEVNSMRIQLKERELKNLKEVHYKEMYEKEKKEK